MARSTDLKSEGTEMLKRLIEEGNFAKAWHLAKESGREEQIDFVKNAIGVDRAALGILSLALFIWILLFVFGTGLG